MCLCFFFSSFTQLHRLSQWTALATARHFKIPWTCCVTSKPFRHRPLCGSRMVTSSTTISTTRSLSSQRPMSSPTPLCVSLPLRRSSTETTHARHLTSWALMKRSLSYTKPWTWSALQRATNRTSPVPPICRALSLASWWCFQWYLPLPWRIIEPHDLIMLLLWRKKWARLWTRTCSILKSPRKTFFKWCPERKSKNRTLFYLKYKCTEKFWRSYCPVTVMLTQMYNRNIAHYFSTFLPT